MSSDEKHPIAAGLVALVTVGLVVGLVLGIVTLVGSHVAGLGGEHGSTGAGGGPSLYLPTPVPTTSSAEAVTRTSQPSAPAPKTSKAAPQITLQAGETSVAPMQRIDLSGVYQDGEGAVLQVQRQGDGDSWEDFPVTTGVSGGTFSTYVQTGRPGVQRFRVRDSDSGLVSNVVSVTVG